ncbi:MAG: hypothetical protein LBV78_18465, partial [Kitasatospora sp.]|nr:hypothetical protein [Kitasatospora sp.]
LPALFGSWLLAFPQPTHVRLAAAAVALLSIGAALLWALGTVLGRAPVETAAPALRPCLCAAVLDAAGPVPAPEWPDDWTDELTDVLWRAVGVGARLRSNHGVERWPAEELRALPADAPPCGGPEPAEPPAPGGARPSPTPRP